MSIVDSPCPLCGEERPEAFGPPREDGKSNALAYYPNIQNSESGSSYSECICRLEASLVDRL